jgi:hypothetical protein
MTGAILAEEPKLKDGFDSAQMPPRLILLDQVSVRMKARRLAEADQWLLEGTSWVEGTWRASGLQLDGRALELEEIAAIFPLRADAQARVFFQDGQVRRGRLTWERAEFESRQFGLVKLRPEAPGSLILRARKMDALPDPRPAAWMMDEPEGQVLALPAVPADALECLTCLGRLELPWAQVQSLRALPPERLVHEVCLQDGSRLLAWPRLEKAGLPAESCLAWARSIEKLHALLEVEADGLEPPSAPAVLLTDGSLITGEMQAESMPWIVDGAELRLSREALSRLTQVPPDQSKEVTPPGASFTLHTQGQELVARPASPHLGWRRGGQILAIPWSRIESVWNTETSSPSAPSRP